MPHYRDGTPAKVNDVVRGTGYNIKDAKGQPKAIVGTVVGIVPDSATCNIQVAHVVTVPGPTPDVLHDSTLLFMQRGVIGCGADGGKGRGVGAVVQLEYGQCDHFEKIG